MMYFIRLVCLLFAFVLPKDTKFLTYFLFTPSHISLKCCCYCLFFFHLSIITLPSYNVLCYASTTDVTIKLLYYFLSVWHWPERNEHCKRKKKQKKLYSHVRCWFVFLSIRLSDPSSCFFFFFNCVPIKTTRERGILGNNIVFLVLSFRGK